MKKGFTLAEIMIVLGIIAVLTGILLPVAFQAAPDENVLKFKKATLTFGTAIRELIGSDRYFADGDLGKKPDGTITTSGEYFCNALADIVNTKSFTCPTADIAVNPGLALTYNTSFDSAATLATFKNTTMEAHCTDVESQLTNATLRQYIGQLILADNVVIYFMTTGFGADKVDATTGNPIRTHFADPNDTTNLPPKHDENGLDTGYQIFCIDVDGVGTGEAPFSTSVRSDGKIFYGARAEEWLKKEVQSKD